MKPKSKLLLFQQSDGEQEKTVNYPQKVSVKTFKNQKQKFAISLSSDQGSSDQQNFSITKTHKAIKNNVKQEFLDIADVKVDKQNSEIKKPSRSDKINSRRINKNILQNTKKNPEKQSQQQNNGPIIRKNRLNLISDLKEEDYEQVITLENKKWPNLISSIKQDDYNKADLGKKNLNKDYREAQLAQRDKLKEPSQSIINQNAMKLKKDYPKVAFISQMQKSVDISQESGQKKQNNDQNTKNFEEVSEKQNDRSFKQSCQINQQKQQKPKEEIDRESQMPHDNLFYQSKQAKTLSYQIAMKVCRIVDISKIIKFIETPILQNLYFKFQIHVYRTFMSTEYLFYLCLDEQMCLLMKAKDKGISIEATKYQIHLAPKFKSGTIALIQSDFKRTQFNIFKGVIPVHTTILGTICNKKMIYLPIVDANSCKIYDIFQNSISNSLQYLHRISSNQDKIQKLRGDINLSARQWFKVSQEQQLQKSKRMNLFVDYQGEYKFFIGKKQTDRFRILAGSGISPLQLFGLAIVLVTK